MAYNVLVVDDSETIRAVLVRTLKITGVEINEIFQAENGAKALEIIDQNWIDIVFADINMPVMNGIEFVQNLVDKGLIEMTPVVIVSTEGCKIRIDEMLGKGVKAFLRKPVAPEALRDVLFDVLEN